MNSILLKDDQTATQNKTNEEISPYDVSYPARLLNKGIRMNLMLAENAAEQIYRTVIKQVPEIAQLQQATKKGFRLVVDASDSTLEAIDQGKIKLTTSKGKTYAQLLDEHGRYSTKLPIKKEAFAKGIDPAQMATAMQMKAMENQLEQISEQLNMINSSVKEIVQGQQNDRIGLYYSGVALYLEAQSVSDKELQRALVAQSLKALSEASFRLTLTMQADINYLENKEYSSAKAHREELIREKISNINQSFGFIHQSSLLRAAIYCNQGELPAMSTVLEEYSRFIEGTVAKNAPLLARCDSLDKGTENGLWRSRANLQLNVAQMTKQLNSSDKTVYIEVAEEEK